MFICSCIFAWSSWDSSLDFSASFFCRSRLFCATAALAWSDAWVDSSTIVFRLSTSFSTWISWLAIVSAAPVYCVALVASPALSASSAMITAWRALALSFSSSSSLALSRISVCFWLAMTLAACSLSRAVLVLGLGDRLLELDLGIGVLVERPGELGREVLPPLLDELEHAGDASGRGSGDAPTGDDRARTAVSSGALSSTRTPTYTATPTTRAAHEAHQRVEAGVAADALGATQPRGLGGEHRRRAPCAPQATSTARNGNPGTLYDITCSAHTAAHQVGDGEGGGEPEDAAPPDEGERQDDVEHVLPDVDDERRAGVLVGVEPAQHEQVQRRTRPARGRTRRAPASVIGVDRRELAVLQQERRSIGRRSTNSSIAAGSVSSAIEPHAERRAAR